MVDLKIATLDNLGTMVSEDAINEFRNGLRGPLLQPGDAGYDDVRTLWNGMIDKRPALIARCTGAADVISSVNFARENNLLVSVRGGDHSAAGNALCDDGLMIDLSLMNSVHVDPVGRTARVGGGTKWRDVDHETLAFGLATTGGTNSDTGVGGLTLGGGLGWLAGKHGLACDNVLSIDLVTANGKFVTASADENPDLFWGLRGGSGNFGVATSFEFRVHPIGPLLLGGMIAHPFDQAREVLKFYADFTRDIPDELNTIAVLLTVPDGPPVAAIAVCYNGDLTKGEEVLQPLRDFGSPVLEQLGPMPYGAIQTMLDDSFPRGRRYYWKGNIVKDIGDELIDAMVEHFASVPSPYTAIALQQLGNASNRVAADATAFSHRDGRYDCLSISGWEDPSEDEVNVGWTRDFSDVTRKFSIGGLYVNGVIELDEMQAAYKNASYDRLVTLKNKYDPTNLFRINPNIKPTM